MKKKKKTQTKLFLPGNFEVKAQDQGSRTFEGFLSTSHLDLGDWFARDIVWPGAFKRTLDHFKASSNGYIPLLDSHDPWSIFNVLGHLIDGEEQLTGKTLVYEMEGGRNLEVPEMRLWTKWQVVDGTDGDRVLDRLRPGAVRKMSMGYETIRKDEDRLADGTVVRNLREVALVEGSLVVFPMNPEADVDLTTVKMALALQSGSLTPEQSRQLKDQIRALLEEDEDSTPAGDQQQKVEDPAPEDPEAPKGLAPEEQAALQQRILALQLRRLGAHA